MKPCLDLCHDKYGNDHRDNVSLIAVSLHMEEQDIPGRDLAVGYIKESVDGFRITDVPCI